jgi:hypothetical protein
VIAIAQGNNRFTLPISAPSYQMQFGNEIETFTNIEGEEKSKLLSKKLKRLSFSSVIPRYWQEIWERGTETVAYESPEQALKILEEWSAKPVVVIIDDVYAKTMLIENVEPTYQDGQMNLHFNISFVEYNPVKTITYSNSKQLLKPGVIITRQAKGRANTSNKSSKKNQTKKDKNKGKTSSKASDKNKKGAFDFLGQQAQKQRINAKNQAVRGK